MIEVRTQLELEAALGKGDVIKELGKDGESVGVAQ